MLNTTITIWVKPENELYFFQILKKINDLPIENEYKWNPQDISISKAMISNWVWINLSFEMYLKFVNSFMFNNGKFQ